MKEEQRKLKNRLTIFFWMNLFLSALLILFLLFQKGINGRSLTEQDFTWERISIILTMMLIPLSLKLFHTQYKKIIKEDLPFFLKKVKEYYLYRILVIDAIILFNLVCFYMIGATNFLYMAIIPVIAFAFCYPTETLVDPIVEDSVDSDDLEE